MLVSFITIIIPSCLSWSVTCSHMLKFSLHATLNNRLFLSLHPHPKLMVCTRIIHVNYTIVLSAQSCCYRYTRYLIHSHHAVLGPNQLSDHNSFSFIMGQYFMSKLWCTIYSTWHRRAGGTVSIREDEHDWWTDEDDFICHMEIHVPSPHHYATTPDE